MSYENNPGGIVAVRLGCTCPVCENSLGRGASTPWKEPTMFWVRSDCPFHGVGVEEGEEPTLALINPKVLKMNAARN